MPNAAFKQSTPTRSIRRLPADGQGPESPTLAGRISRDAQRGPNEKLSLPQPSEWTERSFDPTRTRKPRGPRRHRFIGIVSHVVVVVGLWSASVPGRLDGTESAPQQRGSGETESLQCRKHSSRGSTASRDATYSSCETSPRPRDAAAIHSKTSQSPKDEAPTASPAARSLVDNASPTTGRTDEPESLLRGIWYTVSHEASEGERFSSRTSIEPISTGVEVRNVRLHSLREVRFDVRAGQAAPDTIRLRAFTSSDDNACGQDSWSRHALVERTPMERRGGDTTRQIDPPDDDSAGGPTSSHGGRSTRFGDRWIRATTILEWNVDDESPPFVARLIQPPKSTTATTVDAFARLRWSADGVPPFEFQVHRSPTECVQRFSSDDSTPSCTVPLRPGDNQFDILTRDAKGRERVLSTTIQRAEATTHDTTSQSSTGDRSGSIRRKGADLAPSPPNGPVVWIQAPTRQPPAAECNLSNSVFVCDVSTCDGRKDIGSPATGYPLEDPNQGILADGVCGHSGAFQMEELDLWVLGPDPRPEIRRFYRSDAQVDGIFGWGWDWSLGTHFRLDDVDDPTEGWFSRGDGRVDVYRDLATTAESTLQFRRSPPGFRDLRVYVTDSKIVQVKANGLEQIFDRLSGDLELRRDRYGNWLAIDYTFDRKIERIRSSWGPWIRFEYSIDGPGRGRVMSVADSAGREVRYDYVVSGGRVLLSRVRYPTGSARADRDYEYDDKGRLTMISDVGEGLRSRNEYDFEGRVIRQSRWDDTAPHQFRYAATESGIVEAVHESPAGRRTILRFDPDRRLLSARGHGPSREGARLDRRDAPDALRHKLWNDPERRKALQEDEEGVAWTRFVRDCECGSLTEMIRPDGSRESWKRDAFGNVVEYRRHAEAITLAEPAAAEGGNANEEGADRIDRADIVVTAEYGEGPLSLVTSIHSEHYEGDDGSGEELRVLYDSVGNPIRIDRRGVHGDSLSTEERVYSGRGQLLSVAVSGLQVLEIEYDAHGRVVGRRDSGGDDSPAIQSSFRYDAKGALSEIRKAGQIVLRVDTDAEFRPVAIQDAAGRIETRSYDGRGRLVARTKENRGEDGSLIPSNPLWDEEFERTASGHISIHRQEVGPSDPTVRRRETQFDYDEDGLAVGAVRHGSWDLREERDGRGFVVRSTLTSSEGRVIWDRQTVRDVLGRPIESRDRFIGPGGTVSERVRRTEFDALGRIVRRSLGDPESLYAEATYNAQGQPATLARFSNGSERPDLLVVHEFDARGRRVRTSRSTDGGGDAMEIVRTYEYAPDESWFSWTDESGVTRRTEFDRFGRPITEELNTPEGTHEIERSEYDEVGQLERFVRRTLDAKGRSEAPEIRWAYGYDDGRRLSSIAVQTEGDDGAVRKAVLDIESFDSLGRPAHTTVDGIHVRSTWDGIGRRTACRISPSTGRESVRWELESTENGTTVEQRFEDDEDPTAYRIDPLGRLTAVIYPGGGWRAIRYNALGLVDEILQGRSARGIDDVNDPASATSRTTLHYDELGRLTRRVDDWALEETEDDPTGGQRQTGWATYEYGPSGHLAFTETENTRTEFERDGLGRIVQETQQIRVDGAWLPPRTWRARWKAGIDRVESVEIASPDSRVGFTYDSLGRTQSAELRESTLSLAYEGSENRLERIDRSLSESARASSAVLTSRVLRDPLGRAIDVDHSLLRRDALGVSLSRSRSEWMERPSFRSVAQIWEDSFGRRSVDRLSFDSWGRLSTQIGEERLEFEHSGRRFYSGHDRNGSPVVSLVFLDENPHQICEVRTATDAQPVAYDSRGNLVRFGPWRYRFGPSNELVAVDGPVPRRLLYDALGRVVGMRFSGGWTQRQFLGSRLVAEYGPDGTLRHHIRDHADRMHGVRVVSSGGQVSILWPLRNALGSVRVVANGAGQAVTRFEYGAYGATERTGAPFSVAFAGYENLEGTGLYLCGSRVYAPAIGRFLQRDPAGPWKDPLHMGNPYSYAAGDPVRRRDPSGLVGEIDDWLNGAPRAEGGPAFLHVSVDSILDVVDGVPIILEQAWMEYPHDPFPPVDALPPSPDNAPIDVDEMIENLERHNAAQNWARLQERLNRPVLDPDGLLTLLRDLWDSVTGCSKRRCLEIVATVKESCELAAATGCLFSGNFVTCFDAATKACDRAAMASKWTCKLCPNP